MKFILIALFAVGCSVNALSETINLKITYNGSGIKAHTISAYIGSSFIGSGVTDDNGEVAISVSQLPVKDINLKGEKECGNAKKSWEVSGFVHLDGNNFCHLKMEVPLSEMAEASGGFISEGKLAASYGLICSGGSSSSEESSTPSSNGEELSIPLVSREEMLERDKNVLENKLSSIDRKIAKKNENINSGELLGSKKNDAMYDVKELEVEKKLTQNKLDKVNLTISNGRLKKGERTIFKDREEELKEELEDIKRDRKKNVSLLSEEEKDADLVIGEADLSDMSTLDLKRKKLGLKSTLSKKKLKLKAKKKLMSPNEVTALEKQIATIENSLEVIEEELSKRRDEKEAGEEE